MKEGGVVTGQVDHFGGLPMSCTCPHAARKPCCFTPFQLEPWLQQGTQFFWRLLGRGTDQGFDVSSWGTHSSSPQILPHQILASGWRRFAANNNSIALCGVRSAEESTSTWKKGDKKQQVKIKGTEGDRALMSHGYKLFASPSTRQTTCFWCLLTGQYNRPSETVCLLITVVKSF